MKGLIALALILFTFNVYAQRTQIGAFEGGAGGGVYLGNDQVDGIINLQVNLIPARLIEEHDANGARSGSFYINRNSDNVAMEAHVTANIQVLVSRLSQADVPVMRISAGLNPAFRVGNFTQSQTFIGSASEFNFTRDVTAGLKELHAAPIVVSGAHLRSDINVSRDVVLKLRAMLNVLTIGIINSQIVYEGETYVIDGIGYAPNLEFSSILELGSMFRVQLSEEVNTFISDGCYRCDYGAIYSHSELRFEIDLIPDLGNLQFYVEGAVNVFAQERTDAAGVIIGSENVTGTAIGGISGRF